MRARVEKEILAIKSQAEIDSKNNYLSLKQMIEKLVSDFSNLEVTKLANKFINKITTNERQIVGINDEGDIGNATIVDYPHKIYLPLGDFEIELKMKYTTASIERYNQSQEHGIKADIAQHQISEEDARKLHPPQKTTEENKLADTLMETLEDFESSILRLTLINKLEQFKDRRLPKKDQNDVASSIVNGNGIALISCILDALPSKQFDSLTFNKLEKVVDGAKDAMTKHDFTKLNSAIKDVEGLNKNSGNVIKNAALALVGALLIGAAVTTFVMTGGISTVPSGILAAIGFGALYGAGLAGGSAMLGIGIFDANKESKGDLHNTLQDFSDNVKKLK